MNRRLWVSDSTLTALSANTLYAIGRYDVDGIRAQVIAWYAMRVIHALSEEPLAPKSKALRYVTDKSTEITK